MNNSKIRLCLNHVKKVKTKYFQIMLLFTISILFSQTFAQPADLVLHDTTISATEFFGATNSITAGPNVIITSSGNVTLASPHVEFTNSIYVIGGGDLFVLTENPPMDVKSENSLTPTKYVLAQNYPNPFNPTTTIKYNIPKISHVTLKIYDALGKEVATIVNGEKAAGNHKAVFDASILPSGVYFYQLSAGAFVKTMKMILMK